MFDIHTKPVTIKTSFVPTRYPVRFTEIGLGNSTRWSVTVNGEPQYSTSNSLTVSIANGSVQYSVTPIPGYKTPPAGFFNVTGSAISVVLFFAREYYTIVFNETGLPKGETFGADVDGYTSTVQTDTNYPFLIFAARFPNGTYPFTIDSVSGYNAYPASGNVTIANGSQRIEDIYFNAELPHPSQNGPQRGDAGSEKGMEVARPRAATTAIPPVGRDALLNRLALPVDARR